MFAKLHLLSQDEPEGGGGLRWRAHPYLRMVGAVPKGPAVFDWNERQRQDLEALWRDPAAEGARERLAKDLAAFCGDLGWAPDAEMLEQAEKHGDEYLVTISAVPPELYLLPWEVIQVGAAGTYLSDHASAQVRYVVPGLEPREILPAPPVPGVLFAWSGAGGAVPHEEQAAAIRAAAEAGGVTFRELAAVNEASLQAALDAGPPSVLHLLCHGSPGPEGEPPRLTWGASDSPSQITATHLARMLRRHHGMIRLVVLSACGSGDGHGDPLFMGSMAQELHRKGIPNVVASRYPLSVRGSKVMTRVLYDKMLREAWSLERALRHTRGALFRTDDGGESHPGDAYGIQLYAYDTEKFVSDNNVQAERPVLASYPFGIAARPVPAKGPPAAELTLRVDAEPELSDEELVDKLRRVSEDEGLTVSRSDKRALALIVRTTVDGAQRLLGAWRSKVLQAAVGVIVGELIMAKAITPAMAGNLSAAAGKAGEAAKATGQQAASSGNALAASGQVAASAGQATAAASGKAAAVVAGKVLTAKLVVAAVVGSVAVVGGGVAVYRSQTQSAAPTAATLVVNDQRAPPPPAPPAPPAPNSPVVDPPAVAPATGSPASPLRPSSDRGAPSAASTRSRPLVSPTVAPRPAIPSAPISPAVVPPAVVPHVTNQPAPVSPAASPPDASVPNASVPDASVPDASVPDASVPDAPGSDTSPSPARPSGAVLIPVKLTFTLKKDASAAFYTSENYGHGKPVGFIVPKQDTASGPDKLVTGTKPGSAKLVLSAQAKSTKLTQKLQLNGIRSTQCANVPMHVMNQSLTCGGGKDQSILILTISEEGNTTVPADIYTGRLRIDPKGGNLQQSELVFDYEITIKHEEPGGKTDGGK